MKNNIFYIFLLFVVMSCKTATIQTPPLNEEVVTTINQLLDEKKLPGLNFSIIYKTGEIENYSNGFSDIENNIALHKNHSFFSGSIGKTYAVALLMNLVDTEKVNLKEKLTTYFPGLDWLSRLPNMKDITIEMLLKHTSGLPRYVFKPELWQQLYENPDKVWSYKDRLSMIFDDQPVHEAGKGWAYSDTNYILIGMLIEKITETNYYDLVNSKILIPGNLNQTYPSLTRAIPNLCVGYSRMPAQFYIPNKTVIDGKYVFNPQLEWTGGGMASTTSNLAKWAKLYYEGDFFSSSSLQLITTENPNGFQIEGTSSYGMGSFIYETKHGKAYGHSGFMPGYNSIFIYYPDLGIAAALQTNCDYAVQLINLNLLLDDLVNILIKE